MIERHGRAADRSGKRAEIGASYVQYVPHMRHDAWRQVDPQPVEQAFRRFAEMAAARLPNSRHLVGVDQGHGQAPRTCIPEIMAEFIDTAAVAGLDEDCLALRQFAMPFFLDFTGPSP